MYNFHNSEDILNKKIGSGQDFGNMYNTLNGQVNSNTGVDRINQSISMILGTRLGERMFLSDFGSKLHLLLFERNTYILQDLLNIYIREALSTWEPRIEVMQVTVPNEISEDNIVPVTITYKISNSNRVVNYVYPFSQQVRPLGGEF